MTDRNAQLFASMFEDAPPSPLRRPPPTKQSVAAATTTQPPKAPVRTASKAPRVEQRRPDPLASMAYEDETRSSSSSEDPVSSDDEEAMARAQQEDDGHISIEDDEGEEDEDDDGDMVVERAKTNGARDAAQKQADANLKQNLTKLAQDKRAQDLHTQHVALDKRAQELNAQHAALEKRAQELEKKEGEMKLLQAALQKANKTQRELHQNNLATLTVLEERIAQLEKLEQRPAPLPVQGAPPPLPPTMVPLPDATQDDYYALIPVDVRDALTSAHLTQRRQFDVNLYRLDDGMPGELRSVMVVDRTSGRMVYCQTRCNQL